MIALGMVVCHELPDGVLKRCLSEEDHPIQALLFNGSSGLSVGEF
jgi:hypothetical protein